MKKGCITVVSFLLLLAAGFFFFGDEIVNAAMRHIYPQKYDTLVSQYAAEFALDENLVYAVIKAESKFDETAESKAGAKGLMQLTPQTFEWINTVVSPPEKEQDIMNPRDNIRAGCALLSFLLEHYENRETALCAYNAGIGNVSKWMESEAYSYDGTALHTIPFPETAAYVSKVNKYTKIYQKLYE